MTRNFDFTSYLIGTFAGLLFGVGLGYLFDKIGLGIVLGLPIGIGIGLVFSVIRQYKQS